MTFALPPPALMLNRFQASDASFNGRFITGVVTTGIYCLPSCVARKPLPENVKFFRSEEEARTAGLRACRRCRPDHFYRDHDPDLELVETLVAWMREEPASIDGMPSLASRSGSGASRINELFRTHYHSTPAAVLRRIRIESAAKQILHSNRSILDIALDSGFESLSAFHDSFRREMRMTPGEYRALKRSGEFRLTLPERFLPAYALRIWGRDGESRLEAVHGQRITKGITVEDFTGRIEVRLESGTAHCRIHGAPAGSASVSAEAHRIALRMLGLQGDPARFERRVASDPELAPLTAGRYGLRIPQTSTVFESIVWSIVGQQVNLPFAFKLRRTVVDLAGECAGDGFFAHPTPERIAALDYGDLTRRQFSRSKAAYLIETSRAIAEGTLDVESFPARSATRVRRSLLATRGIGEWTANYVMMRGCGFADCVPAGDTGLSSGLQHFFSLDHRPQARETALLMERFAPHRSLATFHLWMQKGDPA